MKTEVTPTNEKQSKQATQIEQHDDVHQELKDPTIDWIQSDPIVDRGSTFIAYVRQVNTLQDAQEYLDDLLTDKKIAKATHNISSWRIKWRMELHSKIVMMMEKLPLEVDYYICYKYVSIMKYYYFLLISSEFVYTNFFFILFEDDGCMECYSCG